MAREIALAAFLHVVFSASAVDDGLCLMQRKAVMKYATGNNDSSSQLQSQGNNLETTVRRKRQVESTDTNTNTIGKHERCSDLVNQGAYFSVRVEVGTPVEGAKQQAFDVVADTGSDALVVTSCTCINQGDCPNEEKCFQGTDYSSTFNVLEKPVNSSTDVEAPLGVLMVYGSGAVTSIIASDYVSVAGVRTKMDNGVLLMTDGREMDVGDNFQGILGLGPPEKKLPTQASVQKKPTGGGHEQVLIERLHSEPYTPVLFMQAAGVDRYTLCFNDAGDPGALRLNVPKFHHMLPSIGSLHWGLGLYGVSVGQGNTGASAGSAFLCTEDDMKPGMKTPCGAIPDSGTTLIMAPAVHVINLFSELCDSWSRCREARMNNPDLKDSSKSDAFQKLLYNCSDWETDEGIKEVPSIFLDVGGDGDRQKLELTAWSYIVETKEELYKHHIKYLDGVIPLDILEPTGVFKKVCYPSIGAMVYNTRDNGPVWILGLPLFYQYTLGYSLEDRAEHSDTRGAIAFLEQNCNQCDSSMLELEGSHRQNRKRPREVMYKEPRVHRFDTSAPM